MLSAVEGLEVATPAFKPYIVPITLTILALLYAIQKHGTGTMGKIFGPVMVLWFATISFWGTVWIWREPAVLLALNPLHSLRFALDNGWITLVVLGSVFLAVTGAEALYADMGHFGKRPIRLAWFALVFPALAMNYFGQGALLLRDPSAVSNPFFMLVPDWLLFPFVVLATAATVIASQATISGTFSVTRQAVQLGYLPRLTMIHTSAREVGQIYIPAVNWLQFATIVFAVAVFGSSSALASAYGIAVTATMVITTVMTFFVLRYAWNYPWVLCFAATGFFALIELVFFAANILKVFSGGWFTLLIAATVFTVIWTWKRGRAIVSDRVLTEAIDLQDFLRSVFVSPPMRAPGTAVFMTAEPGITPNALLHNLKHNKVLHDTNLFVTVNYHEVPWVGFDKRVTVEPLGNDCWQVTINFGFKNEPDVPTALQMVQRRGVRLDPMDTSYFLSRDIVVPTVGGGMAPWREKLYASLHHNSAAAADFLSLPTNRVVELGSRLEI